MRRALSIVVLLTAFGPVCAQPPPSETSQIDELRREVSRYEEEIRISSELLAKTSDDRTASESELKIIRTQLSNRRGMVGSLEKQMGAIEGQISGRRSDIGRLNRELDRLRGDYAAMVYEAWKNRKLNNFMLFLFSADDFNAAARRLDFMRRYNRARAEQGERIEALADSIRGEVGKLDAARTELDETRRVHTREVSALASDEKQYLTVVDRLAAEQDKLRQDVAEKERLRDRAQRRIAELVAAEVRRSRGTAMSAADQQALALLSGRFDENRGRLPYPLSDGVVIDSFGEHAHHLSSNTRVNNPGVNIAGEGGAQVWCVFEGTVAEIVSIPGYNRCILVRHGSYITVYANLAGVSVRKGDALKAGQALGRIDDSADSDNNFLHFEIHLDTGSATEPLDPEQWLRR